MGMTWEEYQRQDKCFHSNLFLSISYFHSRAIQSVIQVGFNTPFLYHVLEMS